VDGYFRTTLRPPRPLAAGWHDVRVDLLEPYARGQQGDQASGQVLVPRADAAFGVISDLDDTVIHTGLSSLLLTARIVVLGNARTRSPFRGVAAFYSALQQGVDGSGRNPVFYVSSSPWNLYDVVEEFLDLNSIPVGPLFLRGWGLEPGPLPGGGHAGHKSEQIERLLSTYPEFPFVLIGDSGQQDPEIYRDVALARPDRVRAVYLRDVTSPERDREVHAIAREVSAAGVDLILVPDTLAAARHAVEHGLIAASALEDIAEDVARDSAGNVGGLAVRGGDVG
jgi:phosphatidate phosphatase APP1